MYNLKINVTDLLSSKKKIRMKCGFCVFFGCCKKYFVLAWNHWLWYSKVLSGMLMKKIGYFKKKSLIDVCVPMHGKLEYRKSVRKSYYPPCSLSARWEWWCCLLNGPLKDAVPLFSCQPFQSIQRQNAVYLSLSVWDQPVLSLLLISLGLSLQYFVDCEVTMMQRGTLPTASLWFGGIFFLLLTFLCICVRGEI